MEKFKSTEELLAWIIDFFATCFGNSAILKGGMSLRLLHSPRYTNDVDYVFIPFDSKKAYSTSDILLICFSLSKATRISPEYSKYTNLWVLYRAEK